MRLFGEDLALVLLCITPVVSSNHFLNLTALISTEDDHNARFECWKLTTPFSGYPTVGESIQGLANVSNVSYVVLPPRSTEGWHRPPHPMFVTFAVYLL
jgi:hypothetical protein